MAWNPLRKNKPTNSFPNPTPFNIPGMDGGMVNPTPFDPPGFPSNLQPIAPVNQSTPANNSGNNGGTVLSNALNEASSLLSNGVNPYEDVPPEKNTPYSFPRPENNGLQPAATLLSAPSETPSVPATNIPSDPQHSMQGSGGSYTVKSGDTLSQIATANGKTLQELEQLNPHIKNPNIIMPGELVKLDSSASIPSPVAYEAAPVSTPPIVPHSAPASALNETANVAEHTPFPTQASALNETANVAEHNSAFPTPAIGMGTVSNGPSANAAEREGQIASSHYTNTNGSSANAAERQAEIQSYFSGGSSANADEFAQNVHQKRVEILEAKQPAASSDRALVASVAPTPSPSGITPINAIDPNHETPAQMQAPYKPAAESDRALVASVAPTPSPSALPPINAMDPSHETPAQMQAPYKPAAESDRALVASANAGQSASQAAAESDRAMVASVAPTPPTAAAESDRALVASAAPRNVPKSSSYGFQDYVGGNPSVGQENVVVSKTEANKPEQSTGGLPAPEEKARELSTAAVAPEHHDTNPFSTHVHPV